MPSKLNAFELHVNGMGVWQVSSAKQLTTHAVDSKVVPKSFMFYLNRGTRVQRDETDKYIKYSASAVQGPCPVCMRNKK